MNAPETPETSIKEPPSADEVQPKPLSPPVRKKSLLGRLFRFLLWSVVFFVFVLAALGGLLTYYFPSDAIQPMAERELSRFLKIPVRIGGVKISLLHGVEIREVSLGGEEPLLDVSALILDYDLSRLIKERKLVLNQITVDRPRVTLRSVNGEWNFQPLLELAESGKKQPAEPAEPLQKISGLPPIPLAVDLRQFAVNDIRLDLNQEGDLRAHVESLTLQAQGKIDAQGIDLKLRLIFSEPGSGNGRHNLTFASRQEPGVDLKTLALANLAVSTRDLNRFRLSGKIGFKQTRLRAGRALPSPDISADLDVDVAVREQSLGIRRLLLEIDRNDRIELTGTVARFMSDPEFKLRLHQALFRIEDLLKWGKGMIPPVKASGTLMISGVNASGQLPGFKPHRIRIQNGDVELADVHVFHEPLAAELQSLNAKLALKRVAVDDGVPKSLDADLNLQVAQGRIADIAFDRLDQKAMLSAEGANLPDVRLSFITNLQELKVSHPKMDMIRTSLHLDGHGKGNWKDGDFPEFRVNYAVGELLSGNVRGATEGFGQTRLTVAQDMEIAMDKVRAFLPRELKKTLAGLSLSGKVLVRADGNGKLDGDFKLTRAKANASVKLQKLNARLQQPVALDMQQLSGKLSFPAEYDAKRGVKIPALNLRTTFKKVRALENWELGPSTIVDRLTMGKAFNPQKPGALIPITNKLNLESKHVHGTQPEVTLNDLRVDTFLKGDLASKDDWRNVTLEGTVSLLNAAAMKMLRSEKVETAFKVDVHDPSLTRTQASLEVNAQEPVYEKDGLSLKLESVALNSLSRQDLKNGDIEVDLATLKIPSLLSLNVQGTAKNWGETLAVESRVEKVQLALLWEMAPPSLRQGMEDLQIAGALAAKVKAEGRIPEKFDLKNPDLPLNVHAEADLSDVSVTLPGRGIKMRNLNAATKLDYREKTAEVTGNLSLAKLFLNKVLGESSLNPEFEFHYKLKDFNQLTFHRHELTVPNRGIEHSISGRVDGLKPFLTGRVAPDAAELSRRLDIAVSTKNNLQLDQAGVDRLDLVAGKLKTDGAVKTRLNLTLQPGKTIEAEGEVAFDHFDLTIPETAQVKNVNGRFPFKKKLALDKTLAQPASGKFRVSRKGFFNQLREFSAYKNILKIDSVAVKDQTVSDIGLDLLFQNNQLLIEKFLFDVLKGSVAGNLFLTHTDDGPLLNFSTEFAGLDFGSLVGLAEDAESEIDGNIQLGFQIGQGQEEQPISIDQITTKISITRIGAETLDRVLLFIDPEESKPAIVDTRAKLKLASPHRLLISLENGNLNVEAWLKNKVFGDILKAPELKRVPIAGLKRFQSIAEQLQSLTALRDALSYMAARGIEFDENGRMVLY